MAVVEEKVSKVVALVDEGESVPFTFLKTAVAPVEHNRHRSTANILLDEGAQKSFISSRLAAALFLQRLGVRPSVSLGSSRATIASDCTTSLSSQSVIVKVSQLPSIQSL